MQIAWDDQKELLRVFNAHGVEYLIVGAFAVSRYSEPRATKDIDLLLRGTEQNSRAVYRALAEFGAPLDGITSADFLEPESMLQIGVDPVRIDLMQSVAGVATEEAWARRVAGTFLAEEIPVFYISVEDLIAAKLAAGRPHDLLDVARIRKAQAKVNAQNGNKQ